MTRPIVKGQEESRRNLQLKAGYELTNSGWLGTSRSQSAPAWANQKEPKLLGGFITIIIIIIHDKALFPLGNHTEILGSDNYYFYLSRRISMRIGLGIIMSVRSLQIARKWRNVKDWIVAVKVSKFRAMALSSPVLKWEIRTV